VAQIVFLWARCPSYHPTGSVRALKEAHCTYTNHWPDPSFLYPSVTELWSKGVLLHMPALKCQYQSQQSILLVIWQNIHSSLKNQCCCSI